jgi:hypothetical protein
MTTSVQLPVQLACRWRATSVSAGPCLPIDKLHARTRAARLPHGIGSSGQANLHGCRYPHGGGIDLLSGSCLLIFQIPGWRRCTLIRIAGFPRVKINPVMFDHAPILYSDGRSRHCIGHYVSGKRQVSISPWNAANPLAEGVGTRALSRPLALLEAAEPARAAAKRENPSETRWKWVPRETPGWGWWGTEPIGCRYIRYPIDLSRLLSQKSGRLGSKTFGAGR